ncbi:MAG: LacI family DNA-binding transcriptional regulator [Armatimonadota bacterium]|nr:LacI family DNA-binding transcriptional regulator [Armatimonadota bacterium]
MRKRLRNPLTAMAMQQVEPKRLTIREVAQVLGVSTATVSRAIHGRGRISPQTRARILAQLEQLGYTPNLHAQSLARQRSMAVALEYLGAVEVLSDSFLVELARGVQHSLVPHRYRLLLNLTGDQLYRRSVVRQWIRARVVDGVVVVANPCVDPEWLRALASEGIPTVWIAYDVPTSLPPRVGVVQLDLSTGWQEALTYLRQHGHSRIGYLGAYPNEPATEIVYNAAHAIGVQLRPIVFAHGETPADGYEATLQLLQHSPRPTALLVRTDLLAFGALQALQQSGLRVPEDIAVVGHDDLPIAQWVNPPLSSIQIDYAHLGRSAVELLMQLIAHPELPTAPVRVATRFIARRSIAPATPPQRRR